MMINGVPYLPEGWLDVAGVRKMCPEACFFWVIGNRQIGKTYGVLDYMHEQPWRYIFLRHNNEELKCTNSAKINMFLDKGFPWAKTTHNGKGTPLFSYNDDYYDGQVPKVLSTYLGAVGKLRGIPVAQYDAIVFDEFIPINPLSSNEKDGYFLQDFYFTVNSVREKQGRPPVEMWCLANSNNLASPILSHWGLTGEYLSMIRKGQNIRYIPQRKLCLLYIDNSPVSSELEKNALFACLGVHNDYAEMALHSTFVDDDAAGVRSMPIREYTAVCNVDDVTFYKHKSRNEWYIVERGEKAKHRYTSKNPTSYNAFLRAWSFWGLITPVDGKTIYYNNYPAKLKAYKILKLDKKL